MGTRRPWPPRSDADLAHALVAVDFDGTLAPIVPDPADSRPAPGAVTALRRLVEQGAAVAIVTGRNARTVVDLGGLTRYLGCECPGSTAPRSGRTGT